MHGGMQRRHEKGSCSSLSRDIAECYYQPPVFTLNEVVVITTDLIAGETDALEFIAINLWWSCWLKSLLNFTCQRQFTFETFTIESSFNQTRILYADRGNRCQCCQHLQVIFREASFRNW